MDNRQILILLTIGGINVSNKCIDSVSVDRTFADVGDKFSITLIDTPDTGVLYDLELYMASGYRSIVLKYGDISENKLVAYNGTVLDYTNTFVGNIKKLTITGIVSRYIANQDGAASWTYNIDWNSYFNKREDESKNYGAIDTLLIRNKLLESYATVIAKNKSENKDSLNDLVFMASNILNPEFKTAINSNAKLLTLKGPSGKSIYLPIPESFIPLESSEVPEDFTEGSYSEKEYPKFYEMMHDPYDSFWGELEEPKKTTKSTKRIHYPTLFGFKMYLFMDKERVVNKHADGTTKVDKDFLNALCGFRYYEQLPAMKNCALSKEYWLPAVAQFIMGFSWTNKKKNSWYGDFDPMVREHIEMSENIDAEVVWNSEMKAVAVYYIYTDPNTHEETEYGPFIAVKDDGWEKAVNEFVKIAYAAEATIINDTSKTELANDSTGNYYWSDKKGRIRAIMFTDNSTNDRKFFIQANPEAKNSVYGTAGIYNSGIGVDITNIVRQLAILEGWKYKDEYLVQTELVPNSEAFVMKNQSAFEFIIENLVPRAVTPIGEYTDQDGKKILVNTPQSGFYPFFDDDGYFHFQPLVKESIKNLDIPNLGYNIPNSPLLSFQINIKGTAFYTYQKAETSALGIVTGGKMTDSIEIISDQVVNEISKSRHNDTFDAWLGLTYKDVEKYADTSNATSTLNKSLDLAQNALVTSPQSLLLMSGYENSSDIRAKLLAAKTKIDFSTIKATASMWGDFNVAPARCITITNMLKGGVDNSNYPVKHPSSGSYLIVSMQDKIDKSGFIQNLNLTRFQNDVIRELNSFRIDYTKPANYVFQHTEGSSTHVGAGGNVFGGGGRSMDSVTDSISSALTEALAGGSSGGSKF